MSTRARSEQAKQKRRAAILDCALDAFFREGFQAAKMDDIAKSARLSKGTLYLYFDSKEALFEALIHEHAEPKLQMLGSGLHQAESALSGILQLCEQVPRIIRQSPVPKIIKVLISDSHAFPEIVTMYRDTLIQPMLSELTRLLEKGKQNGELNINSPEMVAKLTVAPFIFSAIWSTVFETHDTKLDLNALISEHQTLLTRALTGEKSST